MEAKALIESWVDTFNRGDAEALAEFYHEDAINHQITQDPIEGKSAIKKMFEAEFAQAEMNCQIENIFNDGDWVILEWKDPIGLRGCGFFHILDDKIKFQRGYWDKLSFLRLHNLPVPEE